MSDSLKRSGSGWRLPMTVVGFANLATVLVSWAQSPPSTIQVASLDYGTGRLNQVRTISTELGSNHDPVWSPDGRMVAYVAESPNEDKRVLVIRIADTGSLHHNVSLPLGSFFPLVWAGAYLYGTGWTKQDGRGIYRVDSQTGATLMVHQGSGHIRTSKDGKYVYFGRSRPNTGEMVLIERDIGEGREREVMRRNWFQGMALSPDNRHLVTAGIDPSSNSRTTLLVSLSSGEVQELQRVSSGLSPSDLSDWSKGAKFWHAEWRSEGRSFLTLKRDAGETQEDEMWEVPLSGAPRKLAVRFPRTILTYRLQPGGDKITWTIRSHSSARGAPE